MKQTFKHGTTLDAEEAYKAYITLLYYTEALSDYSKWLRDEDLVVLPGQENAIEQVKMELQKYRQLALKLLDNCEMTIVK